MLNCPECGFLVVRNDRKVMDDIVGYLERYKGEDLKTDLLEILRRGDMNDENLDFVLTLELLKSK